jgi:hypothetical protein
MEKEECPHCGEIVWHYHSRLDPHSYTQDEFNEEWEHDADTKSVRKKEVNDA